MAPITERPAEMRIPAKIAGSAAGSSSFVSTVQRDAFWSWNSSRCPLSTDWRPNSVFYTIGKSEISTQTMMRAG